MEPSELEGRWPECWECDGTGISKCSAIKPCICLTCARRADGVAPRSENPNAPYSVWHDNGGAK